MKTILISMSPGLLPMLEYELDIIQKELDKGSRVVVISCDGNRTKCESNNPREGQSFKPRYCFECKSRVNRGIGWLDASSEMLTVVDSSWLFETQKRSIGHIMGRIDSVKSKEKELIALVNIEGVDLFEAVKSGLQTDRCESNINVTEYWDDFKDYIAVGLTSYYSAFNYIDHWTPDHIYIFNGRTPRYRTVMRAAEFHNVQFSIYEFPISNFEDYTLIEGGYPHDPKLFSKSLFVNYHDSDLSESTKLAEGSEWYKRRFNRDKAAYNSVFSTPVGLCDLDKIPENFNLELYNLVVFISSEDEIVAEVFNNRPFDQPNGIKFISQSFPDIKIWVRMHPRLANLDKKFVDSIHEVCNLYENTTIIPAASTVDSYQLMRSSDLVVGFGSTTVIEAAFMGKRSINIGPSFHESFLAVKHIYTSDELLTFIGKSRENNFSLYPDVAKSYDGACGYAWSVSNYGVKSAHIDRKDTSIGGYMVRNGKKSSISPNILFKIYNRSLDLPVKLYWAFLAVIRDRSIRDRFLKNPIRSIKTKFFGAVP